MKLTEIFISTQSVALKILQGNCEMSHNKFFSDHNTVLGLILIVTLHQTHTDFNLLHDNELKIFSISAIPDENTTKLRVGEVGGASRGSATSFKLNPLRFGQRLTRRFY